ncbi:cytochrome b [Ramlibacter albus]|uniref:Cytochrome b n=1 Tax=Ramlibacter albus TaxID=2079448 RepID=A0A923M7B3_9BURK|nr:cytochrome b [Ramlibacter albus]MBC5764695.1 cytochrome b [Ramlibacter albus]
MHDATFRYTRIAMLLHWVLAAALLYQLVLGWWMVDLPKSPPGLRAGWFNWHKSIGICIGIAVLLRMSWRVSHAAPSMDGLAAWERRAAEVSHAMLYVCMAVLPLSGYLGSVFSGYPVKFFGIVLPQWAAAWPAGKAFMGGLHYVTVWVFMALVAMHVGAAVLHAVRRDGVLKRMGLPA